MWLRKPKSLALSSKSCRLGDLGAAQLATCLCLATPLLTESCLFSLGGELLEAWLGAWYVVTLLCTHRCSLQVRKRGRQASKVVDTNEMSLAMKIDMVNSEAQAEKCWRDRLLQVAEQGACFQVTNVLLLQFCSDLGSIWPHQAHGNFPAPPPVLLAEAA